MFCSNCGHKIPDNSNVCPDCGTWLKKPANAAQDAPAAQPTPAAQDVPAPQAAASQPTQQAPQENPAPQQAPQSNPAPQAAAPAAQDTPAAPKGPSFFEKNKKALIFGGIGLAALVVLIVVIAVIVNLASRIDLTKYIDVSVDGYNGYGHVTYEVDSERLMKDAFGADSYDKLSLKNIEAWYALTNVTIDTEGNVNNASNGDRITLKIKNLESIAKKSGVNLNGSDTIEYTVSGLEEPKSFSANDIFDAKFVGFDGSGCVELTLKDDGLPFNLTQSWGSNIYVDDYYSLSITTPGTEGSLSNGDEYRVAVKDDSYVSEWLLDKYGMFIDSETEAVFTVSGLETAGELDVFSLVDISISGTDGSAELKYHWNSLENSVGDFKVTADYEDSGYFTVYSTVYVPDGTLVIRDENSSSAEAEDRYIASFSISADKTWGISGGDTIKLTIQNYYDDIQPDTFASSGLIFKEVSKEITVDSSTLDRYVTSDKQLSKDNVTALAADVAENVTEYIKNNWSYTVHNSWSFTCYDQEVTSCTPSSRAYLVCTSTYNNSYVLCIPYECKVQDSETDGEKTIYIIACVYSLMTNAATEELKYDEYNVSMDSMENLSEMTERTHNLAADRDDANIAEIKLK